MKNPEDFSYCRWCHLLPFQMLCLNLFTSLVRISIEFSNNFIKFARSPMISYDVLRCGFDVPALCQQSSYVFCYYLKILDILQKHHNRSGRRKKSLGRVSSFSLKGIRSSSNAQCSWEHLDSHELLCPPTCCSLIYWNVNAMPFIAPGYRLARSFSARITATRVEQIHTISNRSTNFWVEIILKFSTLLLHDCFVRMEYLLKVDSKFNNVSLFIWTDAYLCIIIIWSSILLLMI